MFDEVKNLFNKNSLKFCYCMSLEKNGDNFTSNTISFGKSHWDNEEDLNGDHIFRLMSMSKPLTAFAAMQLVEKELLHLDTPAEEILPVLKDIPILNENNELKKQKKQITLRHLLSHTSGLAYNSYLLNTSKKIKNLSALKKLSIFMRGMMPYTDVFSKGPRLFEAGSNFKYGTGLGFAGLMIEKVTGLPLQEYCEKNIFAPLEMKNTFF